MFRTRQHETPSDLVTNSTTRKTRRDLYTQDTTYVVYYLCKTCPKIIGEAGWQDMVGYIPKDCSYRIRVATFVPAAKLIAVTPTLPHQITHNLLRKCKNAIARRKAQAPYYQQSAHESYEKQEVYVQHMYFIEVLEQVYKFLFARGWKADHTLFTKEGLGLEEPIHSFVYKGPGYDLREEDDSSVCLRKKEYEREQTKEGFPRIDSFTEPNSILKGKEKEPPVQKYAARETQVTADNLDTNRALDFDFFLTCLYVDIEGILNECLGFWQKYHACKMKLESAALLTQFAFCQLKARTAEFELETEHLLPILTDEKAKTVAETGVLTLMRDAWEKQAESIKADDWADFLCSPASQWMPGVLHVLEYWKRTEQEKVADLDGPFLVHPCRKYLDLSAPKNAEAVLDPRGVLSELTLREFFRCSKLKPNDDAAIPDFLTQSLISNLDVGRKSNWEPLAFQIFITVLDILDDERGLPWDVFTETRDKLITTFKPMASWRPGCWEKRADDIVDDALSLKVDQVAAAAKRRRRNFNKKARKKGGDAVKPSATGLASEPQPFALYRNNPILLGVNIFDFNRCVQGVHIAIANERMQLHWTAHIYNALRATGYLKMTWPDLEHILQLSGHRIFMHRQRPRTFREAASRFRIAGWSFDANEHGLRSSRLARLLDDFVADETMKSNSFRTLQMFVIERMTADEHQGFETTSVEELAGQAEVENLDGGPGTSHRSRKKRKEKKDKAKPTKDSAVEIHRSGISIYDYPTPQPILSKLAELICCEEYGASFNLFRLLRRCSVLLDDISMTYNSDWDPENGYDGHEQDCGCADPFLGLLDDCAKSEARGELHPAIEPVCDAFRRVIKEEGDKELRDMKKGDGVQWDEHDLKG